MITEKKGGKNNEKAKRINENEELLGKLWCWGSEKEAEAEKAEKEE